MLVPFAVDQMSLRAISESIDTTEIFNMESEGHGIG